MARSHLAGAVGLFLLFAAAQLAWPDPPAVSPSTEPATAPASRYVVTPPPGMHMLAANGRTALCPPKDDDVVRLALGEVRPASRPTTVPSDLLDRLAATRPALVKAMAADLAVPEDKVAAFLGDKLGAELGKMADVKPRIFVLVATQEEVTAAMKAGWADPRFHYNPLADHTFYRPNIRITTDRPMDDAVLWAEVQAKSSPADVADAVVKAYQDTEGEFTSAVSNEAMVLTRNLFIQFVGDNVVTPLKLPPTEQWFGLGLMASMSAKYTSAVTGIGRADLLAPLSVENADNPLKSAPLDLLHPLDPAAIKPQYMPFYIDAMSRKATRVLGKLIEKSGDGVVPKLIAALRDKPPADNDALVKTIQDVTGVDLTTDLLPPP